MLLLPAHRPMVLPVSHAVIAWQPTREAPRALHDALPLLCTAKTVDVVIVDPVIGENRHGPELGADIAVHLARHGIHANVVVHLPRALRRVRRGAERSEAGSVH